MCGGMLLGAWVVTVLWSSRSSNVAYKTVVWATFTKTSGIVVAAWQLVEFECFRLTLGDVVGSWTPDGL